MKFSDIFRTSIETSARAEGSFEYFIKLTIFEVAWLLVSAVFFIFTKEYSLVIISVAGVICNIILIFVGEKHYKFFVALAHLYVMGYVWFSVNLLGWGCGTQYLLFSLVALGFFNPFNKQGVMAIINIGEISLFIYLNITCSDIYPSPESAIYPHIPLLHIISMAAACSFIIYAIRMTGLANSILNQQIQHRNTTLITLANQDGLTGLHNRRSMQKILDENWRNFQKTNSSFFLATCDIDFLKTVNDTKGHEAGDFLIRTFADILLDTFKGEGEVSRWGGDEFMILIQAPTSKSEVLSLIQQLRSSISKVDPEPFGLKTPPSLTIGIASSAHKNSPAELILAADNCMYEGKKQGRNKAISEDEL